MTLDVVAFANCTALERVVAPGTVGEIGEMAFCESGLREIVIGEGVTSIGDYAFLQCTELLSIILPEGVTGIGERAFCECGSMGSIALPESLRTIGDHAFGECGALESIVLPEGMTLIEQHTFSGCNALESVVLPESLKQLCWDSFGSCASLTEITIPAGLENLEYAFVCCTGLSVAHYGGTMAQWEELSAADLRLQAAETIYCSDGVITHSDNVMGSGFLSEDVRWTLYRDGRCVIERYTGTAPAAPTDYGAIPDDLRSRGTLPAMRTGAPWRARPIPTMWKRTGVRRRYGATL